MKILKVGDWVRWHSKTRKRMMTGQIVNFHGRCATIIVTTWDGRGHHWTEPLGKLRKVQIC